MKFLTLLEADKLRLVGVINPGTSLDVSHWIEAAKADGYFVAIGKSGLYRLFKAI